MPPEDNVAVATIVQAQATTHGQLTQLAGTLAANSARSFTGWYDHSQIAVWAAQLAKIIETIQGQVASNTDAYLARFASLIADRPYSPVGAIKVADLRQGVSHTEVYGRVADTYRYQRSLGKDPEDALKVAVDRASVLAETDSALAARAQARQFMIVKKVGGWRRVIHPELSRSGTCGLCIAAADRVYRASELMPLHDRCECTVAPILNGIDPGYSLNRSDLAALYKTAGSTKRADLSKVRITVHHHGELGPVLGVHGQHFRSASDIAA